MLDGMINLLETIVEMQSLGDIDTEGNGIDLSDIFKITWNNNKDKTEINTVEFTEEYKAWREDILKKIKKKINGKDNKNYDKELADAMGSIKINGRTLSKLIEWDTSDWKRAGADVMQGYSDAMAALYKAAISGNYDLDNIAESVKQVLQESGVNNLTIDIGDTTLVITSNGI